MNVNVNKLLFVVHIQLPTSPELVADRRHWDGGDKRATRIYNLVNLSHFSLFLSTGICLSISRWDIVPIFLIISSYHLSFFFFEVTSRKKGNFWKPPFSLLIVFIKKLFNWVTQESRPSVKPVMQKKKGTLTTNRREGGTVQRQRLAS